VQITFKIVSATGNRRDLGWRGICALGAITRAGSSGWFFTYSPAAKRWQEGSAMNLKINAWKLNFRFSTLSPGKLNTTEGKEVIESGGARKCANLYFSHIALA
jgi:hypothetical protein